MVVDAETLEIYKQPTKIEPPKLPEKSENQDKSGEKQAPESKDTADKYEMAPLSLPL